MFSTKELFNKRVYLEGAKKSTGRVHAFVFYAKRCIGVIVKRPDFLWMFRRKRVFIDLNKLTLKENGFYIKEKSNMQKKFNWDKKAVWDNSPIYKKRKKIGYCGNVVFQKKDGKISFIDLQQSKAAGIVLGKTRINEQDIKGYSLNKGAIILEDNAQLQEHKEGVAEKAGKATSVASHKVQQKSDVFHKRIKEFKDEFKEGLK